jgi:hypothetical protein
MSVHAFPSVIEAMAKGIYPLDEWVETIPFETLRESGLERLRRQESLKILVDVGSGSFDADLEQHRHVGGE